LLLSDSLSGVNRMENWQKRIIIDPQILMGKPVIKGTRLSVDFIINLLAQGWEKAEIMRNYPDITEEDIQACLQYASERLNEEKIYLLSSSEGK